MKFMCWQNVYELLTLCFSLDVNVARPVFWQVVLYVIQQDRKHKSYRKMFLILPTDPIAWREIRTECGCSRTSTYQVLHLWLQNLFLFVKLKCWGYSELVCYFSVLSCRAILFIVEVEGFWSFSFSFTDVKFHSHDIMYWPAYVNCVLKWHWKHFIF